MRTIEASGRGRLLSLDAFRGATIAAMLLVNDAGDWRHVFPPLLHAEWNGCTATDLIFPFFLFIMGAAMAIALGRKLDQGVGARALVPSILRRSALLFALGLVLSYAAYRGFGSPYRVLGVLQRIGLCYLFASLIMLKTRPRGTAIGAAAILAAHYAAMKFVPFPGGSAGLLEPGSNLAAYVDRRILGHVDPEGILGTLPAVASVLCGVLAGHWLKDPGRDGNEKVAGLCAAGTALFVAAASWRYSIPFNKALWTSSYVLYTTSLGLFALGTLYWVIDVRGLHKWCRPLVLYGSNSIAIYFGASILAYATVWIRIPGPGGEKTYIKTLLYDRLVRSWIPGDSIASAAYGLGYVLVWLLVAWILYRRRIFIRV